MWLIQLIANIIFIFLSLMVIGQGRRDLRCDWYPKWLGISEILCGILMGVWSFRVWFV